MGGSFLFVIWAGGGNVNPAVAAAQRLLARGHVAHFLGSRTLEARFEAAGIPFTARDEATEWDVDATVDVVIAAAAQLEPDVLVVDYMLAAALCGAEATGLPTVAFVH